MGSDTHTVAAAAAAILAGDARRMSYGTSSRSGEGMNPLDHLLATSVLLRLKLCQVVSSLLTSALKPTTALLVHLQIQKQSPGAARIAGSMSGKCVRMMAGHTGTSATPLAQMQGPCTMASATAASSQLPPARYATWLVCLGHAVFLLSLKSTLSVTWVPTACPSSVSISLLSRAVAGRCLLSRVAS
jgi:hypothetical protein